MKLQASIVTLPNTAFEEVKIGGAQGVA